MSHIIYQIACIYISHDVYARSHMVRMLVITRFVCTYITRHMICCR